MNPPALTCACPSVRSLPFVLSTVAVLRVRPVLPARLPPQRQNELGERVRKLLAGVDLDPMRLAQECAIMADKSDITEEIARLRSHIGQFGNFLEQDRAFHRQRPADRPRRGLDVPAVDRKSVV